MLENIEFRVKYSDVKEDLTISWESLEDMLQEEEYLLLYPMLYTFFGDSVDYEDCKKIAKEFKQEGKELKQYIDYIVDIFGLISDELKEDIITVCLLICAIDGNISAKEKNWIKQLID